MGNRQRRPDDGRRHRHELPSCLQHAGVVGPCFDDNDTNVNSLCNQGTARKSSSATTRREPALAERRVGPAVHPRIRSGAGVTNGPPDINSVWLDGASFGCSEYFNATTTACGARLNAAIDLGSVMRGGPPVQTRTPANAEVRYKIVYGKTGPTGSVCGNFPSSGCDLTPAGPRRSTSPRSPAKTRLRFACGSRTRRSRHRPTGRMGGNGFNSNCQWFFTGAGRSTNTPTDQFIFDNPLQRSFMGDPITSGAIKWLRLSQGDLPAAPAQRRCRPTRVRPARPTACTASTWRWASGAGSRTTRTSRRSRSTSRTRASTSSSTATRISAGPDR